MLYPLRPYERWAAILQTPRFTNGCVLSSQDHRYVRLVWPAIQQIFANITLIWFSLLIIISRIVCVLSVEVTVLFGHSAICVSFGSCWSELSWLWVRTLYMCLYTQLTHTHMNKLYILLRECGGLGMVKTFSLLKSIDFIGVSAKHKHTAIQCYNNMMMICNIQATKSRSSQTEQDRMKWWYANEETAESKCWGRCQIDWVDNESIKQTSNDHVTSTQNTISTGLEHDLI